MSKEKNKIMDKVSDNIPSVQTWRRAIVSAIPYVGGSLDHLLFDKATEIRLQKLEESVKYISDFVFNLEKSRIVQDWFDSVEALEMFKQLFAKIEFEPSSSKVKILSQIYTLFGTKEHVTDPNKYAVLETIAKLTNNQRVVFIASNEVRKESKEYSTGDLVETTTAIWKSTILDYIQNTPTLMGQIKGEVIIDDELDIISSFNLLVNLNVSHPHDSAYRITGLGRMTFNYLRETSQV